MNVSSFKFHLHKISFDRTIAEFFLITLSFSLVVTLLASATRLLQLWYFFDASTISTTDGQNVLWQGLRYDLKIGTFLGMLFGLLHAIPWVRRKNFLVAGLLLLCTFLLFIANWNFYSFYKTPFNVLIFGFFEDDTQAITQTIIQDFPILQQGILLLGISLTAVLVWKKVLHCFRVGYKKIGTRSFYRLIFFCWAMLATIFLQKGTLQGVGLQEQHLQVTRNPELNHMVPNGAIALYYAIRARASEPDMTDTYAKLHELGFATPMEAWATLGVSVANEKEALTALYSKTSPSSPQKRSPNLVFFLMESMGSEVRPYHNSQRDILGRLAKAQETACVFEEVTAAASGTFGSLEGILYHSSVTPLTQSKYGQHPMPWSVAQTLQTAGYHTVFMTSGRSGWRGLGRSLRQQGFQEVIESEDIQARFPEAPTGEWGIPDEYLFAYLQEYLERAPSDRPVFVFVLTVTNHPPYDLPKHHKTSPIPLEGWDDTSDPLLEPSLQTYRYAADLLGQFVLHHHDAIQTKELVVAATGDHNTRTFGKYNTPQSKRLAQKVPFLLWKGDPECGQQQSFAAAHYDLFPTIYPLLNASIHYLQTGRNLLAPIPENISHTLLSPDTLFSPAALPYLGSYQITNGTARDQLGSWKLNQPETFGCFAKAGRKEKDWPNSLATECQMSRWLDRYLAAQYALSDWHLRHQLTRSPE